MFGPWVEFGRDCTGILLETRDLDAALPAADLLMAQHVKQYLEHPHFFLKMATGIARGSCRAAAVVHRARARGKRDPLLVGSSMGNAPALATHGAVQ
jgi:hypothetical protein